MMLAEGSADAVTEAPGYPEAPGSTRTEGDSPSSASATTRDATRMRMLSVEVDGHRVRFGVAGTGPSALFLHGWGLRPTGYRRPIEAMARAGCRVVAPALPGFGGTPELPPDQRNFAGLGAWVGRFLDAVEVGDLALVAGHSFGGGVSTAFVDQQPERVASLLLVNAIGSPTWMLLPDEVRTMVQRPMWDWGRHFGSDLLHSPTTLRVLPMLLEDFIPNLMSNPVGMFRTSMTIRRADLVAEVEGIAGRGVPVSVAWSDRDGLVPRSAFDDLRHAAGTEGTVVEGAHAWLMADPGAFGDLVISALVDGRGRRPSGGAIPLG